MKRCFGFTLAEVLITLAIIGIVAALTIPSVIQKYKEQATVTAVKKVYSTLSQAYTMALAENGSPENWNTGTWIVTDQDDPNYGEYAPDGAINLANILAPYMKTAKNCGTEEGCWYGGNTYKMDGTIYREAERPDMSKVLLLDGTAIAFGGTDYSITKDKDKLSWILVDINGRKSPNTYGHDIFSFFITAKGVYPYGLPDDLDFTFEDYCVNKNIGHGCTAWLIQNGNMDYLHCDDLSWSGKHRCSE